MPDEPAHAANVLPICRAETADDLVTLRNLELSPRCLILQEVADVGEFVPLLINHGLTFVIYNSKPVYHSRLLVLIDVDLCDAFGGVNFERLLRVRRTLTLQTSAFRSQQGTSEATREA